MMACINNNLENVDKLISAGADVNMKDKVNKELKILSKIYLIFILIQQQGRTVAHWASFKGYHQILDRVLKAGVKADERDQDGKTGMVFVCFRC